jgi:hypothetical protein
MTLKNIHFPFLALFTSIFDLFFYNLSIDFYKLRNSLSSTLYGH